MTDIAASTTDGTDADGNISIPYGVLCETHPSYDLDLLIELEDLYQGGYRILDKSSTYLTRMVGEHPSRFNERCKITSYIGYFGQVINQFASALFEVPVDVKAAADASNPDTPGELPDPSVYREFAKDCDRKGATFVDVMKACLTTALKKRSSCIQLDAPAAPEVPPKTRAEEEQKGTDRVYAFEVPMEQLIDWEEDERGLVWATLRSAEVPRKGPAGKRDTIIEVFKTWTMEDGVACWKKYQIEYKKNGAKPNDKTPVPLVDKGTTSFKRIPLLKFTLPEGLWVGNAIGPLAREHFQRRSALIGSQNRSLCAIPWVKRGSEIGSAGGALPSETQQDPNRGANPMGLFSEQGWVGLGADDTLGFAEPQGHCYELVNSQLSQLKDTMFSISHQMAASISGSSTTALGRSGLSKQKDTESTAKVLAELGAKVRQFAALVYRTISEARDEDVIWTAHGLDTFEPEDRQQVLEESVSLDQVAIPSVTFRKHHKFATAKRLLGPIDPATLEQIKTEIEDGVEREETMRSLMQDAQSSALAPKPPSPPQNPTVLGMQAPVPGGHTPPGGVPQPGGALADSNVGQGKAIKMAGTPSEAAGATMSTMGAKVAGASGQPLLPDNAHHQSGAHVDAKSIYDMLSDDYSGKYIKWVLTVPWVGPVEVPITSVDTTNMDRWQASQPEDADHVQHFIDKLSAGETLKPIILANNPSNDDAMLCADGHHRLLASMKFGAKTIVAYVAQIGSNADDVKNMHDSQRGGASSKQKSNQSAQSNQKSSQSSKQSSKQGSKQG